MRTSASRYPNHPPIFQRLKPVVQEGFAWWRKIHVFYLPSQRQTRDIFLETGRLSDVIVRQVDLLVISNGRATTQIPIAHHLS